MAQTEAVTVCTQVAVDTPIERAFAVFTDRSRVELEHRHIDLGRYAALVQEGR